MNELIRLGINELDYKQIVELNPLIEKLSDNDIKEIITILEDYGCTSAQIKNIIVANSLFLNKSGESINDLLRYLKTLGFDVNNLIEGNPNILSLEVNEIERYIKNRIDNNESLEDIINDLDSNLFLFDEI